MTIFITLCFLLAINQLPRVSAQVGERGHPIGEMISRGQVKFEGREGIWKDVEHFNFPIFYGQKIKTQRGMASIVMEDNSQIDVDRNSLLYFDQDGLHLL